MARDTAGKWIIGLVIYFVGLSFIMVGVGNISSQSIVNVTEQGAIDSLSSLQGYCDLPRFYTAQNGVQYQGFIHSQRCDKTIGFYDEIICNSISGCGWENVTTGALWWKDTTQACKGRINVFELNNNVSFTTNIGLSKKICSLAQAQTNQTLCYNLGCTYFNEMREIEGVKFLGFIKDVFTLQVSFGFDNNLVNLLLSFIFVYFPMIIFIMSLIILIR